MANSIRNLFYKITTKSPNENGYNITLHTPNGVLVEDLTFKELYLIINSEYSSGSQKICMPIQIDSEEYILDAVTAGFKYKTGKINYDLFSDASANKGVIVEENQVVKSLTINNEVLGTIDCDVVGTYSNIKESSSNNTIYCNQLLSIEIAKLVLDLDKWPQDFKVFHEMRMEKIEDKQRYEHEISQILGYQVCVRINY